MSYMKWLSQIDTEDLTEMKELYESAIKENKDKIIFKSVEYETDYIKSVLNYLTDFHHQYYKGTEDHQY